jgi:HEAT repeat protein
MPNMNSSSLLRRLLICAALLCTSTLSPAAQGGPPVNEQVLKLAAVLNSTASEKEKADACRELARIGTVEAVVPLGALLPDEKLSHMARYAMETIPSPEVDKVFRAALSQLRGRQLVGVVGSVGFRRDLKAVPALANLLKDSDSDVAQASARALGKIGDPAAAEAIQRALPGAAPADQLAFCEGLLRCAETLASEGHRRQATAAYDMLRRLNSPHHQVRTAALRGAILTRGSNGLPLLSEALRSPDFSVFAAAARISYEMPDQATTKALVKALSSGSVDSQIMLTQTLGTRGDPVALPALFAAARYCEKPVRVAAIRAVAQFGRPSAVFPLLSLLGDSEREVSQAALEALAASPCKEADEAVLKMFRSSEISVRDMAMDLILRRRMVAAIPELFNAASGSDPALRLAATKRLGELVSPREIPGLIELLAKASTPQDIEAVEQALSSVAVKTPNRESCAEQLGSSFGQARTAQKCALLRVLGAVGSASALKTIRSAVADASPEVRASAIRALGGWNSAEAAPDLLELARSAPEGTDRMLSLRSYLGLAAQPELPAADRLAMCRQAGALVQKDDEKKLLLAALGNLESCESVPLIQPFLDDAAIKEEASVACVNVSEKLLKEKDAAKHAARLLEPLQKVATVTANADLSKRAQALLEQARAKADGTTSK